MYYEYDEKKNVYNIYGVPSDKKTKKAVNTINARLNSKLNCYVLKNDSGGINKYNLDKMFTALNITNSPPVKNESCETLVDKKDEVVLNAATGPENGTCVSIPANCTNNGDSARSNTMEDSTEQGSLNVQVICESEIANTVIEIRDSDKKVEGDVLHQPDGLELLCHDVDMADEPKSFDCTVEDTVESKRMVSESNEAGLKDKVLDMADESTCVESEIEHDDDVCGTNDEIGGEFVVDEPKDFVETKYDVEEDDMVDPISVPAENNEPENEAVVVLDYMKPEMINSNDISDEAVVDETCVLDAKDESCVEVVVELDCMEAEISNSNEIVDDVVVGEPDVLDTKEESDEEVVVDEPVSSSDENKETCVEMIVEPDVSDTKEESDEEVVVAEPISISLSDENKETCVEVIVEPDVSDTKEESDEEVVVAEPISISSSVENKETCVEMIVEPDVLDTKEESDEKVMVVEPVSSSDENKETCVEMIVEPDVSDTKEESDEEVVVDEPISVHDEKKETCVEMIVEPDVSDTKEESDEEAVVDEPDVLDTKEESDEKVMVVEPDVLDTKEESDEKVVVDEPVSASDENKETFVDAVDTSGFMTPEIISNNNEIVDKVLDVEPTIVSSVKDDSCKEVVDDDKPYNNMNINDDSRDEVMNESYNNMNTKYWSGDVKSIFFKKPNSLSYFKPIDANHDTISAMNAPFSYNEDNISIDNYVYGSDENSTLDPTDETQIEHVPLQNESLEENGVADCTVLSNDSSPESQHRIVENVSTRHDDRSTSTRLIPETNDFRAKTPFLSTSIRPAKTSNSFDMPSGIDLMEAKKQATMDSIISFLQGLSEQKNSEKRRAKPPNTKTSKGYKKSDDVKTDNVSTKNVSKSPSSKLDSTNTVLFSQIRRMQTRMINNFQKSKSKFT
jgi:hypothetical protein